MEDFYDATNNFKAMCGMVIWIYISRIYTIYTYVYRYNKYLLTRSTRWNDEMNELFARLYLVLTSHTHGKLLGVRVCVSEKEHSVSYMQINRYIYVDRYGTRQSVRQKIDKSICSYIVMQIQSRMRSLSTCVCVCSIKAN